MKYCLNTLVTANSETGTTCMTNSEDSNKMSHSEAFYSGLHCLQRHNRSSEKEIYDVLENTTCDPSIYTTDHLDFIVYSMKENSISLKRIKSIQKFEIPFHLLSFMLF